MNTSKTTPGESTSWKPKGTLGPTTKPREEDALNRWIPKGETFIKILSRYPNNLIETYPFLLTFLSEGKTFAALTESTTALKYAMASGFCLNQKGEICLPNNPNAYSIEASLFITNILDEIVHLALHEKFGTPASPEELQSKENILTSIFGRDEITRQHFQFRFATNTFSTPMKSLQRIQMVSEWIDNIPQEIYDYHSRYAIDANQQDKEIFLTLNELRDGELCYHLYIPKDTIIYLGGYTLLHDPRIIIHSIQNFQQGSLKQLST